MSDVSALSCAQVRELAAELALGILSGAERAEVLLHVNGCARCQAYVAELTEAADVIPQLAPEAEPPAGFESRVLRRLDGRERSVRRRWIAAAVAVAAAAIIVSVTVVRVIESNDTTTRSVATQAFGTVGSAPVAVAMEGGVVPRPAGWAFVHDDHGVAVSVDYGIPSGRYAVQVTSARGASTSIGTMEVVEGRG
ncbi:MAG TPA: zf-HC2 domain-containing protein, partial [Acidimicrobiia bacterium]|nr:zf-HC2 domain-containing protein [Acidimicrobiia bacterium]